MIDLETEELIPLSIAARDTPNRNGTRGVNSATAWRWMQRGVRGVKLETVLVGGTRMTSREAMRRFFVATTAAASGEPLPVRTAKQRERAITLAENELSDAGI